MILGGCPSEKLIGVEIAQLVTFRIPGASDHNPAPYVEQFTDALRRELFNHVIQSASADTTILALLAVDRWIRDAGLEEDAILFHTVHDCMLIEARNEIVPMLSEKIKQLSEDVAHEYSKGVPFLMDVKAGKSWRSVEELEVWEEKLAA